MFKLANTLTLSAMLFASTVESQSVKGYTWGTTVTDGVATEPTEPTEPIGGQQDVGGCMVGAGYSWCESSHSCVRKWEVPCADDYNDCPDCLEKQRKGQNIACPMECNMIIDTIDAIAPVRNGDRCAQGFCEDPNNCPRCSNGLTCSVTAQMCAGTCYGTCVYDRGGATTLPTLPTHALPPMPPTPVPMPVAEPPTQRPRVCPEVMCMMYCENGFDQDEMGCNTCSCIVPPVVDYARPVDPPVDPSPCPIPYVQCSDPYVCPKITEITQCNQGGIAGYTTYRLSLVIQNERVQNIYAIYGDDHPTDHPMDIPPAYQSQDIFNSNIGGVAPGIESINTDAEFDSWLTIGLTNGDPDNKISQVGLDMDSWSETNGIYTTNGAVFTMDPEEVIVQGLEYVIGQLTIPTNDVATMTINVQGKIKSLSGHNTQAAAWQSEGVQFTLQAPESTDPLSVPMNCIRWNDGCNTCYVSNGVIGACTRVMCFREDTPYCISYSRPGH